MGDKISSITHAAILEKVFSGCVVGVVRKNGERLVLPFGKLTYEQDAPVIREDSIFDVASITKSIPTACLALKLIDEKRLNLDDRLINFVPEFRNSDRENVLIKHLLTQTLDFGLHLSSYKDRLPEDILDVIFTSELRSPPGSKYSYANATSILLGLAIEKVYGKPLDVIAYEIFFSPLGMTKTTFHPNRLLRHSGKRVRQLAESASRISNKRLWIFDQSDIGLNVVPTEIDPWRGRVIQGEVHDESAYILSKEKVVGSAGLFSTAPDLLIFLEMLINKGIYMEKRHLSQNIINLMLEDKLGWEFNQPRYMGKFCHKKMFGKTGFTGCSVIVDPIKGIGIVFLSNYHYPKRRDGFTALNSLRSQVADIILQ